MALLTNEMGMQWARAEHCCFRLSSALGPMVSFPQEAAYNSTIKSYWTVQEASLSPSCIVVPETSGDVSTAVKTILDVGGCHFAIKSQGHAPAAHFANINNGVTIDTTHLDTIVLSSDHGVASIGPGAAWVDVYRAVEPYGVQVAGGRNGAVGVGGLILGGGISYFGPRVGWACDTVVNFEVVTANGEIVNANASSNPDLWKSLKGGANNLGLVTRMDLKTIPQGEMAAGNIITSVAYRDQLFQAFADIASSTAYDPYASLITGGLYNLTTKSWIMTSTVAYTKPDAHPAVYQNLFSVPNITNTFHITNLSTLSAEPALPQNKWLFYTATFNVSGPLLSAMFNSTNQTLFECFHNVTGSAASLFDLTFEPLPTVFTQWGPKQGGNILGTTPADGNSIILLLSAQWDSSLPDSLVQEAAEKVVQGMRRVAKNMGMLKRFVYTNYANRKQKPLESYGAENVALLDAAAKKYDPNGVFQKKVPGGFKL